MSISVPDNLWPGFSDWCEQRAAEHPDCAAEIDELSAAFKKRYVDTNRTFRDRIALMHWYATEFVAKDKSFNPPQQIQQDYRNYWRETLAGIAIPESAIGRRTVRTSGNGGPIVDGSDGGEGEGGQRRRLIIERATGEITHAELLPFFSVAEILGAKQTVMLLVAAGALPHRQQDAALSAFKEFFGERPPMGGGGGVDPIMQYPDYILRMEPVAEVLEIMLREQVVYRELMRRGIDTLDSQEDIAGALSRHEERISNMERDAREILEDLCTKNSVRKTPELEIILDRVVAFFKDLAELPIDDNLIRSIRRGKTPDKPGAVYPFPSLRQRDVAVASRTHNQAPPFAPDKGKTAAAVLSHLDCNRVCRENGVPEGRALFISSIGPATQLPERFRSTADANPTSRTGHEGYWTGHPPNARSITKGMSVERVDEAIGSDWVFAHHQILYQKKGDIESDWVFERHGIPYEKRGWGDVVDRILWSCHPENPDYQRPIRTLIVDEWHNLHGGNRFFWDIARLIAGIPELFEHGRIIFPSATPIKKDLASMHRSLSLLRELSVAVDVLRQGMGKASKPPLSFIPEELRADTLRMMPGLDEKVDWFGDVNIIPVDLSEREYRYQKRTLIDDSSIPTTIAINWGKLFVLNPRLVSGSNTMPQTFLNRLVEQVRYRAEKHRSILIIEDLNRHGVADYLEGNPDDAKDGESFIDERFPPLCNELRDEFEKKLSKELGHEVRFRVIYGGMDRKTEHEPIHGLAKESKESKQSTTIVLAMRSAVAEGIDGSCYTCQMGLQHPSTRPDYEQVVFRTNREDNECDTDLFLVRDSAYQAQYDQAEINFRPIAGFMEDRTLNEVAMANITRADDDESTYATGSGTVERGTKFVQHFSSQEQSVELAYADIENKGARRANHIDKSEERQEKYLNTFVRNRNGSNIPEQDLIGAGILRMLEKDGLLPSKRVLSTNSNACGEQRALHAVEGDKFDWEFTHIVPYERFKSDADRLAEEDDIDYFPGEFYTGTVADVRALLKDAETNYGAVITTSGFSTTLPPRLSVDDLSGDAKYQSFARQERIRTLLGKIEVLDDNGLLIMIEPAVCMQESEAATYADRVLPNLGIEPQHEYCGTVRTVDEESGETRFYRVIVGRRMPLTDLKGILGDQLKDHKEYVRFLLPDLSAADFATTHFKNWPKKKDQREHLKQCGKRKTLDRLHCTDFELDGRQFSVPYRTEITSQQIETTRHIESVVELLLELHYKQDIDLNKLSTDVIQTLAQMHVTHSEFRSSPSRPAFYYEEEVDGHIIAEPIYPLDPAWQAIAEKYQEPES